jgi:hypothetical protein
MTENNKIFIFQSKKKSIIGRFLDRLSLFSCLALSFYFNYKFIGGNDFFDVIIFISFFMFIISIMNSGYNTYYNVSEKELQEIKKFLNKLEGK